MKELLKENWKRFIPNWLISVVGYGLLCLQLPAFLTSLLLMVYFFYFNFRGVAFLSRKKVPYMEKVFILMIMPFLVLLLFIAVALSVQLMI